MNFFKKMTVTVLSFMVITTMGFGFTADSFAADGSSTATDSCNDVADNLSPATKVETSRVAFNTTQVKWDTVSKAEGYVVTAVKKGSKQVTTKEVKETDAAYTKLSNNSQYRYAVKAYKEVDGAKKYSSVKSTDYVVSGYVKSTDKTSNSVSLEWSPITDASKYRVEVTNGGKNVKTVAASSSHTKVTGLSSKTKYNFNVVAYNVANEAITSKTSTVTTNSRYIWPVKGSILSGFGYRSGYGSSYHEGIDISASTRTSVKAAMAGKVISAGGYFGYGKCVKIRHSNGIVTLYGHLSRINVHKGQRVGQGKVIGKAGSTGSATCVHLHFEVQVHGVAKNPVRYLP